MRTITDTQSTTFDLEAAVAARAENPALTVFDTGEMLEPQLWPNKSGNVDFEDSESATVATICAYPSPIDEDTTVIEIDTAVTGNFKILLNNGTVFEGRID